MKPVLVPILLTAGLLTAAPAFAQAIVTGLPTASEAEPTIVMPPSVGDGVANGVLKPSTAPSVGNGVANGSMKAPGAPSVGDGIGNGVVKSITVQP